MCLVNFNTWVLIFYPFYDIIYYVPESVEIYSN